MAHLTKPTLYNIEDSNIALLGSDVEKHVREHAGDKESTWNDAGLAPGLQVWRIENFQVRPWPNERVGFFYDGDSYIVLHTYQKPHTDILSFDLHFWLGKNTSQDEAGTAAYKTVELDDHLHGKPVQVREVQGFESPRFLSYFPHFICIQGGVATGFHHVHDPPPMNMRKLYRVTLSRPHGSLVVREVPPAAENLVEGDVYVLDKGSKILQFNTRSSSGTERFKAAEFSQNLANERRAQCEITVYDQGGHGAGVFLGEFSPGTQIRSQENPSASNYAPTLFKIFDNTGALHLEAVEPATQDSLVSSDAFLLDHSSHSFNPAIYVWLGKTASLNERRLVLQYAQKYLHDKSQAGANNIRVAIPIVKMEEGSETEEFLKALER